MTPVFAIIGTGKMAAMMMMTMRRAGVEVVAVASRERSRGEYFALSNSSIDVVGDWQHVVRLPQVDAVYIATHPKHHAQIAVAALEQGKAVLCEKPLADDPQSASLIVETSRRTGSLCVEALWTMFLPSHRRFFELLDAGRCGTPKHLTASFGYPEVEEHRCRSTEAGGLLLDRVVYLAAFALRALGPVGKVTAEFEFGDDGSAVTASLMTVHEGGAQAQLAASFVVQLANSATLSGTAGCLALERPLLGSEDVTCRRHHLAAASLGARPLKVLDQLRQVPLMRRLKRQLENRAYYCPYGSDRYRAQLDHFLSLYHKGENESPIWPLDMSLRTSALLEQARKTIEIRRLGDVTA